MAAREPLLVKMPLSPISTAVEPLEVIVPPLTIALLEPT
jgi:hypothetical protein